MQFCQTFSDDFFPLSTIFCTNGVEEFNIQLRKLNALCWFFQCTCPLLRFIFFSSIFLPSPVFISEWSLKVFLGDLKANAARRSVLWWCKTDFLKWLKAMRWLGQGLCYMFRVQHISAWHPALCKVWWSRAQRHPMVGNKSYQFSATVLGFSCLPQICVIICFSSRSPENVHIMICRRGRCSKVANIV